MDGMVGGGIYLGPMREDLILEWGESTSLTSPNFHTAFSTSIVLVLVRFSLQFRLPTLPKSSPIFSSSPAIFPAYTKTNALTFFSFCYCLDRIPSDG